MRYSKNGFTLVELLIAAVILAILAAIIVPNFMEAKSRAKIAQAKNDLRTIDVALNAYIVDHKNYPYPHCFKTDGFAASFIYFAYELSTPVAYLQTTHMLDPFEAPNVWQQYGSPLFSKLSTLPYSYQNFAGSWAHIHMARGQQRRGFIIYSTGPDRWMNWPEFGFLSGTDGGFRLVPFGSPTSITGTRGLYDPTNGTMSSGDITRFGGDLPSHPSNGDEVF